MGLCCPRDVKIVFLQSGRLKFAEWLPFLKALVRELQRFRVKITQAANETFAADWRDGGEHDDLVFAVAWTVWWAERTAERDPGEPLILGRRPNPCGDWW